MKGRWKKFFSYYKPYKSLFLKDMFCAMIASCITLVFPILTRYITGTILTNDNPDISLIYWIGLLMLVLVIIEYTCNFFIGYMGHEELENPTLIYNDFDNNKILFKGVEATEIEQV